MEMKPISILVADDDEKIVKLVSLILSEEGWHILTARDGEEVLQMTEEHSPDLVVLDIVMPKLDGFEVCRRLRQRSRVPIIALSARGEIADKVKCLNLGADDYITKPFGASELIARIRAVFRRNEINDFIPPVSPFSLDSIRIDFDKRRVYVHENEVSLTPTEYNLLVELVANINKTLTYIQLLAKVWGPEFKEEREYLHVYIGHLRNKLESDPKKPKYIISVPRVGYRFQK
jgi:two-component system KDP operon response regulator KdpE